MIGSRFPRVLILPNSRGAGESVEPAPAFIRGEVIRATVQTCGREGVARLLLKGRSVLVKTPFHFEPGTQVHLKVEATLPSPVLRCMVNARAAGVLPGLATLLSALKENIWKAVRDKFQQTDSVPEQRSNLAALIKTLSSGVYRESAAGLLEKIIDHGGFNWESKLARLLYAGPCSKADIERLISNDLKGLAARGLFNPKDADADLEKLLAVIRQVQLLNRPETNADRKLFFPIPIEFADGHSSVAQLLLQFPKQSETADQKQNRTTKGLEVFLLVELSFLGPVRAELCLRGKRIDGRFLLIRPEARRLVEAGLFSLTEPLERSGFSIGRIQCLLADADIVQRPLVGEMISERENALCLVA